MLDCIRVIGFQFKLALAYSWFLSLPLLDFLKLKTCHISSLNSWKMLRVFFLLSGGFGMSPLISCSNCLIFRQMFKSHLSKTRSYFSSTRRLRETSLCLVFQSWDLVLHLLALLRIQTFILALHVDYCAKKLCHCFLFSPVESICPSQPSSSVLDSWFS